MDQTLQRTCSYCNTRQPVSALAQSEALGWQCRDTAACEQRAFSGDLYARRESEYLIAEHELQQGALP